MAIAERYTPAGPPSDRAGSLGALMPLAVALSTALAAWFALRHLGREPFTRDEVAAVTDGHRSLGGTLAVVRHREGNMWPYYLLLNGWTRLGGTGEGWVRLPGALCAVASVPALMVLARRMFGDVAAVVAGIVLACSPLLIDIAQLARSYGIVALLVVVCGLLFIDGVEQPRRRTWILWGLVGGTLVHLHMLAGLIVLAQGASLLLLPPRAIAWRDVRAGALTLSLVALPMAIYAAVGDSGQTSWIPAITLHAVAGFGKLAAGSRPLELLEGLLFVGAAIGVLASLRAGGRSIDAWRRGFVLLWVAVPPLALAATSIVKPLFQPVYLTGIVPGLALMVGMIAAVPNVRRVALPAAGLVALLALATEIDRPHPTPVTEDLRGAATFVATHTQPGDGIAYAPAFARPGLAFYLAGTTTPDGAAPADVDQLPGRTPEAVGDLFGEEAPPARVADNLRAADRVWLVGYPRSTWHPTPEPVLAVAPPILRSDFTRIAHRRFGELDVQLYRHR